MTEGYPSGSSLLLAGRFISLLTNFAVQVLTVRYLAKAYCGAFACAITVVSTGANFSLLGLNRAINRFVPIYHEERDYPSMFGTIFLAMGTVLGFGLAIAAVMVGLQGVLGNSVVADPLFMGLLTALIGLVPIQAVDSLLQSLAVVFIGPRSLFYRRHLLGPCLRLAAVLLVMAFQGSVYLLAACYLAAGLFGLGSYAVLIYRALRKEGLLTRLNLRGIRVPARRIFKFSIPFLSTDLLLTLQVTMAVMVLEHFRGASDVAELWAVVPVAGLCLVVYESLKLLFTPTASRLSARHDTPAINDLYLQSSIWVTVLTFPVFAVCCFLAEPVTELLFGARYAGAGILLALLAAGYYVHSALGMTTYMLQVCSLIRLTIAVNVATALFGLGMNLWLVHAFGAPGAAAAITCTLVVYNVANYVGVLRDTGTGLCQWRHVKVYVTVLSAISALSVLQFAVHPPIAVTAIAIIISFLALLCINWKVMQIDDTFPFLSRLLAIRPFLVSRVTRRLKGPSAEIGDHITANAGRYFPDLGGAADLEVKLTRSLTRKYSSLHEFDLRAPAGSHRIMVKVLHRNVPSRLEHAAIEKHFGRLDDRFGTMPIFDLLPPHAAVVMESIAHPTLMEVLQPLHRLRHRLGRPQLEEVFRNAGAWLSRFHSLPESDQVKDKMAGREEFLESIRQSCEVLRRARINGQFLRQVRSITKTGALAVLPDRFQFAGHLDYGPHNIFVGPGTQVRGIDTWADCRVPIYKDIAYFLLRLKAMPPQSYRPGALLGRAALASCEKAFLSGYFGVESVPTQAIRLFEIEATLKKWAQRASTCRQSTGLKRVAKQSRMILRGVFYRRHVAELLADLHVVHEARTNGAALIQRPAAPAVSLKVHVVRPAEMDASQLAVWSRIQQSLPWLDSPFFTAQYTRAVDGVRGDVRVAILEHQGEIVGFLPFQRAAPQVGRPVGLRLTDLYGPVLRGDISWNPAEVIRGCGLNRWHFTSAPVAQEALQSHQLRTVDSPYIDLARGYKAYIDERRRAGSEWVQQAQRKRRKMEREIGPLRFEWQTTDRGTFDALLRLKAEKRRSTNTHDVLQSSWAVDLLESIRHSHSDEFTGILSALYLGDEVVAVHLGMRTPRVLHWWVPAFNPEFRNYSPGLILLLELIRHCADSGIMRIDLGRGNERYKASLMTDTMPVADGCVTVRRIDWILQRAWFAARATARSGPLRGPVRRSKSVVRRFLTGPIHP